jgi:hypothetical protein
VIAPSAPCYRPNPHGPMRSDCVDPQCTCRLVSVGADSCGQPKMASAAAGCQPA